MYDETSRKDRALAGGEGDKRASAHSLKNSSQGRRGSVIA